MKNQQELQAFMVFTTPFHSDMNNPRASLRGSLRIYGYHLDTELSVFQINSEKHMDGYIVLPVGILGWWCVFQLNQIYLQYCCKLMERNHTHFWKLARQIGNWFSVLAQEIYTLYFSKNVISENKGIIIKLPMASPSLCWPIPFPLFFFPLLKTHQQPGGNVINEIHIWTAGGWWSAGARNKIGIIKGRSSDHLLISLSVSGGAQWVKELQGTVGQLSHKNWVSGDQEKQIWETNKKFRTDINRKVGELKQEV